MTLHFWIQGCAKGIKWIQEFVKHDVASDCSREKAAFMARLMSKNAHLSNHCWLVTVK